MQADGCKVRVVSHHRSGTHMLCRLLFDNLQTGADHYEQLQFSHYNPPDGPYIHMYRALYPVAVSMWRLRERLGFNASVTFHDFITVPLEGLSHSEFCYVHHNEEPVTVPGRISDAVGTLPDRWARYMLRLSTGAALNVNYSYLVENPTSVVRAVGRLHGLAPGPFVQPKRSGWWADGDEQPEVSFEDAAMLEDFSRRTFEAVGL